MKRFKVFTIIFSVLVFGAMLQAGLGPRLTAEAKNDSALPRVYDATGAMLEAIRPKEANAALPLVYDATGAMLEATSPKKINANANQPIVYDATGAMLEAINP